MTIGQTAPAVPGIAGKPAVQGAEDIAAADMFSGIIAGMAVGLDAEAVEGEAAATAEAQPKAPGDPAKAAEAVVQLLSLTARQQGKARGGAEAEPAKEQPHAECELEVPTLGEDGSEALPLAKLAAVPTQHQQPTAPIVNGEAEATDKKPQLSLPPAETAHRSAELAEVRIPRSEVEKSGPTTVAAAQITDLLKAVTKPVTLANARLPAPGPSSAKDDAAPSAPDARSFVQTALSSAMPPSLAPLEAHRPLDALLEPIVVEPQIDPSEFAIERQLDVSAEGEWLDSLAKDIARTAGEGGTLRFKLNPENLGTLRVEITPHANGQAVRLTADTDAARAIIADAQPRLVAEAKANGVRISETHVDLGQQNAPGGDPRRQNALFEEAPIRTARFLRDQEESDGKPTRDHSERYA